METQHREAYQYLFGPVPSRRLGMSLGVDLMPHKTCSLDCVYCECGKTTHLTVAPAEMIPAAAIQAELDAYLSPKPRLDHVTFSGSGEPTLHNKLFDIITYIKKHHPAYPVALLTNGTLFHLPEVRASVRDADIIIASLDAASETVFRKLNRPHPALRVDQMIDGLVALRNECNGRLWIEIFIVPGMNDASDFAPDEIEKIRAALRRIKPDHVHLNTIDRPGTESWVARPDAAQMKTIQSAFQLADVISEPGAGCTTALHIKNAHQQIIATIRRRPCTATDISRITGIAVADVERRLAALTQDGVVSQDRMHRGVFYRLKRS